MYSASDPAQVRIEHLAQDRREANIHDLAKALATAHDELAAAYAGAHADLNRAVEEIERLREQLDRANTERQRLADELAVASAETSRRRVSAVADLYAVVRATTGWLDGHNGADHAELTARILKVVEEVGEAAAAWIGAIGQNPRKGITHSSADVAAELGDVAFTALVAIASLGHDPAAVMAACAAKVAGRIEPAGAGVAEAGESRG